MSFKRKQTERSLAINAYGKLNKDNGLYDVVLDVTKDISEKLIGDYEVTVHAADYRSNDRQTWSLGEVKFWFKEGHEEGSNNGIRADHKPLPTINFTPS